LVEEAVSRLLVHPSSPKLSPPRRVYGGRLRGVDSEREGPSSPISGPVMSSCFAPSVEPKEKLVKRSSTLGELRALGFALVAFGPSLNGERVNFEVECSAPVSALSQGSSPKPLCLGVIQRCLALLSRCLVIPCFRWVRRGRNRVANAASNSELFQVHALAGELHGVCLSMVQPPSLTVPQTVDLRALKGSFLL